MVVFLYFVHYNTLLQNVTGIITICDSYFIKKCDKSLLQNGSAFLVQNATVLLQNVIVITKCDVYAKYSDRYLDDQYQQIFKVVY